MWEAVTERSLRKDLSHWSDVGFSVSQKDCFKERNLQYIHLQYIAAAS